MTLRQMIGWILISIPFLLIAVCAYSIGGWGAVFLLYGTTGVIVGCVIAGVTLTTPR